MAGRNAQERFRILERRKRVAGRYLQGTSQWEIGRRLGVTQQCIAKDVRALEKEWLASAVVDINAALAPDLAAVLPTLAHVTAGRDFLSWRGTWRTAVNPLTFR